MPAKELDLGAWRGPVRGCSSQEYRGEESHQLVSLSVSKQATSGGLWHLGPLIHPQELRLLFLFSLSLLVGVGEGILLLDSWAEIFAKISHI